MACCGDVPAQETMAAVQLLEAHLPDLKIRVINVVDLMKLQLQGEHPHALSDANFDELFTRDKPIIFAFHGYPGLVHRLTWRRTNQRNLIVHGYRDEGTTTTPFDLVVMNELDRFHLALSAIENLPLLGRRASAAKAAFRAKIAAHKSYVDLHGDDMPEIRNWKWSPVA